MAKINTLISAQNFEIIRDRIGAILTEELANQWNIGDYSDFLPTVWISRVTPFDKTEIPAINISLSTIDFSNKDARSVDGNELFNIDIYTSAPYTSGYDGDTMAAIRLHKISGICRAVLENPVYRTLGFPPPFNGGVAVSSIRFYDPNSVPDATNQTVGQIQFSVRCPEGVSLLPALDLVKSQTGVKLELTDRGFVFEVSSNGQGAFSNQFTHEFS